MASASRSSTPQSDSRTFWLLPLLLIAGFLFRLRLAWLTFLNPDEALHYFLANQSSLRLAYEASLTTAHPPLMIVLLHFWSRIGHSEFFLRLPFVAAATLFCWVMFLWVRRVAGVNAACFALALCLFAPSLIALSAEIRQYAFLLLFCSCSLYFLERAIEQDSIKWMMFSAIALYLALLTHYSALIFAAAAGVYALLRLPPASHRPGLIASWITSQLGGVAIFAALYVTQISKLRQSGLPSEIASTWLRGSVFHGSDDHVVVFACSRTLRLFRYFFSHGTIGVLALVLFGLGVVTLLLPQKRSSRLTRRSLAVLLILPFAITLGAAIAGAYPYGGTRHDAVLAMFAIPGIAIGLDRLPAFFGPGRTKLLKIALLAAALVICNVFPSPSGPYIRPRNQRRELMLRAMSSLRDLPPNSIVFTDDQGSMMLNYYLCGEMMPLPFASYEDGLLKFGCGNREILVATNTPGGFNRTEFAAQLAKARVAVSEAATIYLFQSGWIDDKERDWLTQLRSLGGVPQNFGPNILICSFSATPPQ